MLYTQNNSMTNLFHQLTVKWKYCTNKECNYICNRKLHLKQITLLIYKRYASWKYVRFFETINDFFQAREISYWKDVIFSEAITKIITKVLLAYFFKSFNFSLPNMRFEFYTPRNSTPKTIHELLLDLWNNVSVSPF